MNKAITIIILALINLSCSAQKTNIKAKKLNLKEYKNLPLYPGVIDNPESSSHFYLYKNKIIRYSEYNGNISIQENIVDSPYMSLKVYSQKTLMLIREDQFFYNFCIGSTKVYNEKGVLINSIDCDLKYVFSVSKLIEKIKTKYSVDLTTRKANGTVSTVSRNYSNGKDCYDVTIYLTSSLKGPMKNIIIDGNTGEVISEIISKYNPTNDPRI